MSRSFAFLSRSPRCVFVLLALGLLLVGCSTAPSASVASPMASSTPTLSGVHAVSTAASRTYLGAVSGTQALLGIVLGGAQVRAYVCDGTPSRLARLAEWMSGQVKGDQVQASGQDQQAQLTARLTNQRATGTLRLASGRVYSFSLLQVSATARVGVFEGTALIGGQRYYAGWLLLPGGEQRGAATYYPSGPIRGQIVIALLPKYPSGSAWEGM